MLLFLTRLDMARFLTEYPPAAQPDVSDDLNFARMSFGVTVILNIVIKFLSP